jgi:hypothetical protein
MLCDSGTHADPIAALTCDGTPGAFSKNCARCAKQHHKCVWTEAPLIPFLNDTIRARAALAAAVRAGDDEEEESARRIAVEAGEVLIAKLKALKNARSRLAGDRVASKKRAASSAGTPTGDLGVIAQELQSIRRVGVALVEAQKIVSSSCTAAPLAWRMLTNVAVPLPCWRVATPARPAQPCAWGGCYPLLRGG